MLVGGVTCVSDSALRGIPAGDLLARAAQAAERDLPVHSVSQQAAAGARCPPGIVPGRGSFPASPPDG